MAVYGVTVTVTASGNTAKVPLGFVTRTSQACVPKDVSTAALTVITIVLALTTSVPVTWGAVPWLPSKLTVAPFAKAVPLRVKFTVVLAWAVFGVMLSRLSCGVGVMATVAGEVEVGGMLVGGTVGEAGAVV